jgi:hypothetical protein
MSTVEDFMLGGARHCDEYITDPRQPKALRWFLLINRMPAVDAALAHEMGVRPRLFATHEGRRCRVVMASRFGDVGITYDLGRETGYQKRVPVAHLGDFGDQP